MSVSLLITSTGRVSRHVISTLLSSPHCPAIRVMVKFGSGLEDTFPPVLLSPPHSIAFVERFEGEKFRSTFKDIDIVFHDGPVMDLSEVGINQSVIDAAKVAGVKHFVLCTSFQPIRSKMEANTMRLNVEEYLIESRLNYTILEPGMFMQNLALDVVIKTGKIPMGFSSDILHGFIDLADLATVREHMLREHRADYFFAI
ncbi:hypothetical protein M422DRAFT_271201 [Sphaerobolus stellatus SS14]|uniref:NAD(P)-binding domain-containing protein n=1 Tax=Sphaerobolus stellatus (strain SS14) TaxID=990650 RepID=A0A0C9TE99_SPHS4|nr:hypothetical protein M422DRAFT_271201 [Sphaerobolus stellatus SS14]